MRIHFTGTVALLALCVREAGLNADAAMLLQNVSCSVTFDPVSLQVSIKDAGKAVVPVFIAQTNLGPIANLASSATNAS